MGDARMHRMLTGFRQLVCQSLRKYICQSTDNLASRYSDFTYTDFQTIRTQIIINGTMDGVAATHKAIVLVNEVRHLVLDADF